MYVTAHSGLWFLKRGGAHHIYLTDSLILWFQIYWSILDVASCHINTIILRKYFFQLSPTSIPRQSFWSVKNANAFGHWMKRHVHTLCVRTRNGMITKPFEGSFWMRAHPGLNQ
jgi:hypothetical protein